MLQTISAICVTTQKYVRYLETHLPPIFDATTPLLNHFNSVTHDQLQCNKYSPPKLCICSFL